MPLSIRRENDMNLWDKKKLTTSKNFSLYLLIETLRIFIKNIASTVTITMEDTIQNTLKLVCDIIYAEPRNLLQL